MLSLVPFEERRGSARLKATPLRRRVHVRSTGRSSVLGTDPTPPERRKSKKEGFDVAVTLELNLDRCPTKPAMLTFVKSVLYSAETGEFGSGHSGYVEALKRAIDVLEHSTELLEAVATLQGYQAYMDRHPARSH
jgi:hypothetical protein